MKLIFIRYENSRYCFYVFISLLFRMNTRSIVICKLNSLTSHSSFERIFPSNEINMRIDFEPLIFYINSRGRWLRRMEIKWQLINFGCYVFLNVRFKYDKKCSPWFFYFIYAIANGTFISTFINLLLHW